MRISDWSSDVCSSDLLALFLPGPRLRPGFRLGLPPCLAGGLLASLRGVLGHGGMPPGKSDAATCEGRERPDVTGTRPPSLLRFPYALEVGSLGLRVKFKTPCIGCGRRLILKIEAAWPPRSRAGRDAGMV